MTTNFDENKKMFPLEKILTANARDYCESVGKALSEYEMRGITNVYIDNFRRMVPREAKVVVDYRQTGRDYVSGTALIPKQK